MLSHGWWPSLEQRTASLVAVIGAASVFLFFVPLLGLPPYQSEAQSCGSASPLESAQAEPELFEPCIVPEFGSVTYYALGTGGVWMESDYAHYYAVCVLGQTHCS